MRPVAVFALALLVSTPMLGRSDEGMWLLNDPPKALLKERHQFDLTDPWLERAMKANVRFNSGGSGGFVSADGLIVTNHHIAADALQKLSTKDKDLFALGFYAKDRKDEAKCPDLELNVLQSIEDVTAKVNAAVKGDLKPAEAAAARRAIMTEIEKDSLSKTGLRSDVVTLYQGGAYHLYRYKKYTDVRLVFAPEQGIAAFGGDVDNFEYPRHGLDFAFFRAYEDGAPVKSEHHFKWSEVGPKENDVVFVTGHPGTTNRLETLDKLKHRRDHTLPYTLNRLRTMEAALTQYGDQGPEQRRQAATALHSAANARKAFSGQLQGLLDPNILEQKRQAGDDMLQKLQRTARDPDMKIAKSHKAALEAVAKANENFRTFEKLHALFETGHAYSSELFVIARHCVRLGDELLKKSPDRLREYRDTNLDSLKFGLFSPAPIDKDLERARLQASLTFMAEQLGGEHPGVEFVLNGKNPAARANELVESELYDPEVRKKLVADRALVFESRDPMVRLARTIDSDARRYRKKYEDEVEEVERQAYAELARLRFMALGNTVAPDATFTLRLAFGVVKGYDVDGQTLPFHTTFGGAFDRAAAMKNREPFELPERWVKGKDKLDLKTPFDFVSTADTIGGNSGSPVLNRDGELVGINFDRNRHGLVRNFVYTEVQARHVAVHSRAVLEALRKLYDAGDLAKELTGR